MHSEMAKIKNLILLIPAFVFLSITPLPAKEPIKPVFADPRVQALIDRAWTAMDYDLSLPNLDEAIKCGEEALALDPGNYVLLCVAANFYSQKVVRMPTETKPEKEAMLAMARKGYDYARKSLAIKETAAGYTWAISCYSMLYRDRNFAAQLTASPEIVRLVNKIEECDQDYFYGVSARLRSRMALVTPKLLLKLIGGTLAGIEEKLDHGISLEPAFLDNYVDKSTFLNHIGRPAEAKRILEWVLRQDPDARPALRAWNRYSYDRTKVIWKEWTGADYPNPLR